MWTLRAPSSAIESSAIRKSSSSSSSCPTTCSASRWFGEIEKRLGLGAEPQRLALGVEHDRDAAAVQVAHRLRVEALLDAARQRAGEDDVVRAAREVVQLLEQHLELFGRDLRPPLVDLRVRALGRVDDCGRGTRLLPDPHEVVEDRLGRQLLDDARTGAAAGQPGRDDGHFEPLQRAGDVDPLAAGKRQHLARPVTLTHLEVRHGQRAVERCVQRDGDDHPKSPPRWWSVRPA